MPPLSERCSVPSEASTNTRSGDGAAIPTIEAAVGALTLRQRWPPSVVRARTPLKPPAYATLGEAAWSTPNEPTIRPPTADQVAPPSFETSALPSAPAATARVEDANSTANVWSVAGTIDDQVSPPSAVRSSVPVRVSARHVVADPHRILPRSPEGTPFTSLRFQVVPPSSLFCTIRPLPTA